MKKYFLRKSFENSNSMKQQFLKINYKSDGQAKIFA